MSEQQQRRYVKRLDRSRPYGTYHPPDGRCHFNQDGYDFDHEGFLVDEKLTDEQRERLVRRIARPGAKPAAAAARGPKHRSSGKTAVGHSEPPPPPADEAEPEDGLNLEAWLRGEESYDLADIQHAVKSRYHVWKTAKRDLVLFLVEDQKLVEPDVLTDEFRAIVG